VRFYDRAAMLGNCYNDDRRDFVFVFICSDRCTTTASFARSVARSRTLLETVQPSDEYSWYDESVAFRAQSIQYCSHGV